MASDEALREHYEATNRRDYAGAMTYYDEAVVLVSFAEWFAGQPYYGIDAVGKAFGDWMRAFSGGVTFEDMLIERGHDAYAMSAHMTARGGGSGVEIERDWAWVYWMRSGKIVRVEIHEDMETARAVAGVNPS